MRVRSISVALSLLLTTVACEGPVGPAGDDGEAGERGEQGEPGNPGANVDGGTPWQVESDGVVGVVTDGSGAPVAGGIIYWVPAGDVAGLQTTEIDVIDRTDVAAVAAEAHDEPLEDLIEMNGAGYTQAAVQLDGTYRLTALPDGNYFQVYMPDDADFAHLPGGSQCRVALGAAALRGTQQDIRVSSTPSPAATPIGSATCMTCHGRHRAMRSRHFITLETPGRRGNLQDTSSFPDFDAALAAFEASGDLYFHACDAGDGSCAISATDPGAGVRFIAHLHRVRAVARGEVGAYTVDFETPGGGETAGPYDVILTIGGGGHRQGFITRIMRDGKPTTFVLPFEFAFAGDYANGDPADWPWRDYQSSRWFNRTAGTFREPTNDESFDSSCAGCHFNGFGLTRTGADGPWSARAVAEPNGVIDFDLDGRMEETSIGCEACHGPGSEHLETRGFGSRIVSPALLTPGRANLVCGRCHSRPQGIGAGSEAPLSAELRMPVPGIRRADFAVEHTTRVDGAATDFFSAGDSRSSHQQYSDFIRTAKYRNDDRLLTCFDCHDAHGNDDNVNDLLFDPATNDGCTACHAGEPFAEVITHIRAQIPFEGHPEANPCGTCHLVRTALSATTKAELIVGGSAYRHGDIASHRFRPTRIADYATVAEAAQQPLAATRACAVCHSGGFGLPTP